MDSLDGRKPCTTRNIKPRETGSHLGLEDKLCLIEQDLDTFFSSEAVHSSNFQVNTITMHAESSLNVPIDRFLLKSSPNDKRVTSAVREVRLYERFELNTYDREKISLTDLLIALEPRI
jgi:hypothetical protein